MPFAFTLVLASAAGMAVLFYISAIYLHASHFIAPNMSSQLSGALVGAVSGGSIAFSKKVLVVAANYFSPPRLDPAHRCVALYIQQSVQT